MDYVQYAYAPAPLFSLRPFQRQPGPLSTLQQIVHDSKLPKQVSTPPKRQRAATTPVQQTPVQPRSQLRRACVEAAAQATASKASHSKLRPCRAKASPSDGEKREPVQPRRPNIMMPMACPEREDVYHSTRAAYARPMACVDPEVVLKNAMAFSAAQRGRYGDAPSILSSLLPTAAIRPAEEGSSMGSLSMLSLADTLLPISNPLVLQPQRKNIRVGGHGCLARLHELSACGASSTSHAPPAVRMQLPDAQPAAAAAWRSPESQQPLRIAQAPSADAEAPVRQPCWPTQSSPCGSLLGTGAAAAAAGVRTPAVAGAHDVIQPAVASASALPSASAARPRQPERMPMLPCTGMDSPAPSYPLAQLHARGSAGTSTKANAHAGVQPSRALPAVLSFDHHHHFAQIPQPSPSTSAAAGLGTGQHAASLAPASNLQNTAEAEAETSALSRAGAKPIHAQKDASGRGSGAVAAAVLFSPVPGSPLEPSEEGASDCLAALELKGPLCRVKEGREEAEPLQPAALSAVPLASQAAGAAAAAALAACTMAKEQRRRQRKKAYKLAAATAAAVSAAVAAHTSMAAASASSTDAASSASEGIPQDVCVATQPAGTGTSAAGELVQQPRKKHKAERSKAAEADSPQAQVLAVPVAGALVQVAVTAAAAAPAIAPLIVCLHVKAGPTAPSALPQLLPIQAIKADAITSGTDQQEHRKKKDKEGKKDKHEKERKEGKGHRKDRDGKERRSSKEHKKDKERKKHKEYRKDKEHQAGKHSSKKRSREANDTAAPEPVPVAVEVVPAVTKVASLPAPVPAAGAVPVAVAVDAAGAVPTLIPASAGTGRLTSVPSDVSEEKASRRRSRMARRERKQRRVEQLQQHAEGQALEQQLQHLQPGTGSGSSTPSVSMHSSGSSSSGSLHGGGSDSKEHVASQPVQGQSAKVSALPPAQHECDERPRKRQRSAKKAKGAAAEPQRAVPASAAAAALPAQGGRQDDTDPGISGINACARSHAREGQPPLAAAKLIEKAAVAASACSMDVGGTSVHSKPTTKVMKAHQPTVAMTMPQSSGGNAPAVLQAITAPMRDMLPDMLDTVPPIRTASAAASRLAVSSSLERLGQNRPLFGSISSSSSQPKVIQSSQPKAVQPDTSPSDDIPLAKRPDVVGASRLDPKRAPLPPSRPHSLAALNPLAFTPPSACTPPLGRRANGTSAVGGSVMRASCADISNDIAASVAVLFGGEEEEEVEEEQAHEVGKAVTGAKAGRDAAVDVSGGAGASALAAKCVILAPAGTTCKNAANLAALTASQGKGGAVQAREPPSPASPDVRIPVAYGIQRGTSIETLPGSSRQLALGPEETGEASGSLLALAPGPARRKLGVGMGARPASAALDVAYAAAGTPCSMRGPVVGAEAVAGVCSKAAVAGVCSKAAPAADAAVAAPMLLGACGQPPAAACPSSPSPSPCPMRSGGRRAIKRMRSPLLSHTDQLAGTAAAPHVASENEPGHGSAAAGVPGTGPSKYPVGCLGEGICLFAGEGQGKQSGAMAAPAALALRPGLVGNMSKPAGGVLDVPERKQTDAGAAAAWGSGQEDVDASAWARVALTSPPRKRRSIYMAPHAREQEGDGDEDEGAAAGGAARHGQEEDEESWGGDTPSALGSARRSCAPSPPSREMRHLNSSATSAAARPSQVAVTGAGTGVPTYPSPLTAHPRAPLRPLLPNSGTGAAHNWQSGVARGSLSRSLSPLINHQWAGAMGASPPSHHALSHGNASAGGLHGPQNGQHGHSGQHPNSLFARRSGALTGMASAASHGGPAGLMRHAQYVSATGISHMHAHGGVNPASFVYRGGHGPNMPGRAAEHGAHEPMSLYGDLTISMPVPQQHAESISRGQQLPPATSPLVGTNTKGAIPGTQHSSQPQPQLLPLPTAAAAAAAVLPSVVTVADVQRVIHVAPRAAHAPQPRRNSALAAGAAESAALGPRMTMEQEYREAFVNLELAKAAQAGERWACCDIGGVDVLARSMQEREESLSRATDKLNTYRGADAVVQIKARVTRELATLQAIRLAAAARTRTSVDASLQPPALLAPPLPEGMSPPPPLTAASAAAAATAAGASPLLSPLHSIQCSGSNAGATAGAVLAEAAAGLSPLSVGLPPLHPSPLLAAVGQRTPPSVHAAAAASLTTPPQPYPHAHLQQQSRRSQSALVRSADREGCGNPRCSVDELLGLSAVQPSAVASLPPLPRPSPPLSRPQEALSRHLFSVFAPRAASPGAGAAAVGGGEDGIAAMPLSHQPPSMNIGKLSQGSAAVQLQGACYPGSTSEASAAGVHDVGLLLPCKRRHSVHEEDEDADDVCINALIHPPCKRKALTPSPLAANQSAAEVQQQYSDQGSVGVAPGETISAHGRGAGVGTGVGPSQVTGTPMSCPMGPSGRAALGSGAVGSSALSQRVTMSHFHHRGSPPPAAKVAAASGTGLVSPRAAAAAATAMAAAVGANTAPAAAPHVAGVMPGVQNAVTVHDLNALPQQQASAGELTPLTHGSTQAHRPGSSQAPTGSQLHDGQQLQLQQAGSSAGLPAGSSLVHDSADGSGLALGDDVHAACATPLSILRLRNRRDPHQPNTEPASSALYKKSVKFAEQLELGPTPQGHSKDKGNDLEARAAHQREAAAALGPLQLLQHSNRGVHFNTCAVGVQSHFLPQPNAMHRLGKGRSVMGGSGAVPSSASKRGGMAAVSEAEQDGAMIADGQAGAGSMDIDTREEGGEALDQGEVGNEEAEEDVQACPEEEEQGEGAVLGEAEAGEEDSDRGSDDGCESVGEETGTLLLPPRADSPPVASLLLPPPGIECMDDVIPM